MVLVATPTIGQEPGDSDRPVDEDAKKRLGWIDDPRFVKGCYAVAGIFGFFFVQQWFWPAPPGVIVQGVLIGSLTALVAFGIALIYRANRVINFAQGDLGGVPASLAVLLIV